MLMSSTFNVHESFEDIESAFEVGIRSISLSSSSCSFIEFIYNQVRDCSIHREIPTISDGEVNSLVNLSSQFFENSSFFYQPRVCLMIKGPE